AEVQQPRRALVGRPERREQAERVLRAAGHRLYSGRVVLVDDVEAAVARAGRFAEDGGTGAGGPAARAAGFAEDGATVAGVLPAEAHPGARVYLCAFHSGDGHRTW